MKCIVTFNKKNEFVALKAMKYGIDVTMKNVEKTLNPESGVLILEGKKSDFAKLAGEIETFDTTTYQFMINEITKMKHDLSQSMIEINKQTSYDKDLTDENLNIKKSDVVNWLSEHELAFKDAINFFHQKPNKYNEYDFNSVNLKDLIGWIADHRSVYIDFKEFFK